VVVGGSVVVVVDDVVLVVSTVSLVETEASLAVHPERASNSPRAKVERLTRSS
jgi:hypothetical protein